MRNLITGVTHLNRGVMGQKFSYMDRFSHDIYTTNNKTKERKYIVYRISSERQEDDCYKILINEVIIEYSKQRYSKKDGT